MIQKYAAMIFESWMAQDMETMLSLLEPADSMLDVGCGDGSLTKLFASKVHPKTLTGMDTIGKSNDFTITQANINEPFPYSDSQFGCVISHYSLEHLYNTELFLAETHRVLKSGGYTVVATDNLSSWPNIISLVAGYQTFSVPVTIKGKTVGNPFALRTGAVHIQDSAIDTAWRQQGEYTHNKVLSYRTLLEAYTTTGFAIETVVGVGYFPFRGTISHLLANIDIRHAHFLILKARKMK